jgi:hypothetical protein
MTHTHDGPLGPFMPHTLGSVKRQASKRDNERSDITSALGANNT